MSGVKQRKAAQAPTTVFSAEEQAHLDTFVVPNLTVKDLLSVIPYVAICLLNR